MLTKYYTSSVLNVQHEILRKRFQKMFVCIYTWNVLLQRVWHQKRQTVKKMTGKGFVKL